MGSSSEGLLEKGPFLRVEDGNIRNMPTKTVREKDVPGSFK